MTKTLLAALVVLTVPGLAFGDSCRYTKDINFTIDAAATENLILDVGAGSLLVRGDANSREIIVTAQACASTRRQLDELELLHESRGSDIEIHTEMHRQNTLFRWWGSWDARIDIEMVVPSGLSLRVDDSSGTITIAGVAALKIDDGSGSIHVSNILGDVEIDDGSGPIDVRDVGGTVSIDDGSGDLKIANSNAVHIIDDGSGSIRIEEISGDVYIEEDGSGGIDIRNVGGDVIVEDSGSGSLNVSAVAGNFTADDDG